MASTMGGLARILSDNGGNRYIPLVWNAYETAARAHRGQRRKNGDPFITHPIEVATIEAEHGGTVPAICTALLHDVIEDAALPAYRLRVQFGAEIAAAVHAVTTRKIREPGLVSREVMLVAMADRLHNLRTLRPLPPATREWLPWTRWWRAIETAAAFGGGAAPGRRRDGSRMGAGCWRYQRG